MSTGDVKNVRNAKKQKTNRDKSLYKQLFLFGRAYPLLRINLTLGVHSYAFGQALTAAAAPLKVRLIRSEHFSLSPEKKRLKMSGTQKNKRQIETNLCINSCFYSSELTISLGRRDLSGCFLVHICVFYSSYSSHFAFLCTSSKFFRAKMEPDILLKIYVITMNSHIKNT